MIKKRMIKISNYNYIIIIVKKEPKMPKMKAKVNQRKWMKKIKKIWIVKNQ